MPDRFPLPTPAEDARIVEADVLDDAEVEMFVRRIPTVIETLSTACDEMESLCRVLRINPQTPEGGWLHEKNLGQLRHAMWIINGRLREIERNVHEGRTHELS